MTFAWWCGAFFGAGRWRHGEARGAGFFSADGAARFCDSGLAACLAVPPPAQPAARIGIRIQAGARTARPFYPVKLGFAFFGFAAGALPATPPPPPLPFFVVVVAADVDVPVDDDSVEALVVSGVVVVIVVTAVVPPVVIVETIVVVAWAPNGAAPAVQAAVAAPNATKTAKAAPHATNFR